MITSGKVVGFCSILFYLHPRPRAASSPHADVGPRKTSIGSTMGGRDSSEFCVQPKPKSMQNQAQSKTNRSAPGARQQEHWTPREDEVERERRRRCFPRKNKGRRKHRSKRKIRGTPEAMGHFEAGKATRPWREIQGRGMRRVDRKKIGRRMMSLYSIKSGNCASRPTPHRQGHKPGRQGHVVLQACCRKMMAPLSSPFMMALSTHHYIFSAADSGFTRQDRRVGKPGLLWPGHERLCGCSRGRARGRTTPAAAQRRNGDVVRESITGLGGGGAGTRWSMLTVLIVHELCCDMRPRRVASRLAKRFWSTKLRPSA